MSTAGRLGITPQQQLMLRAGLGDRAAADAAWSRWLAAYGYERLDGGSFRLLPLVSRNRSRHGLAVDPRLRGVHRQAWYRNQLLLRGVARAAEILAAAGIRCLLLKGVPLALRAYRDLGARPMHDADVLVPPGSGPEALRLLAAAGWSPAPGLRLWPPRNQAGWPLRGHGGLELDLHAYAMTEGRYPGADDGFLARATPFEIEGHAVLALGPADQLLHALVHGSWWNPEPPVRWVADVALLLRGAAIDWDVFVAEARARRVTAAVREALAAWAAVLGEPLPAEPMAWLAAVRVSLAERLEQRARVRPPVGLLGSLPRLWLIHRRAAARRAPRPLDLLDRLAEHWSADGPVAALRQVPARLGARLRSLRARRAPRGAARGEVAPATVVEVHAPALARGAEASCERLGRMLDAGLAAAFDCAADVAWRRVVGGARAVGIKVNAVGWPWLHTSPELILACVDRLRSAGALEVVVFDRFAEHLDRLELGPRLPVGARCASASARFTQHQYSTAGYDPEVHFETPHRDVAQRPDRGEHARRSHLCLFASRQVERIVNLSALKHHPATGSTLSLKNLSHGLFNNVFRSHADAASFVAAACSLPAVRDKVGLHVVEAIRGLEDGGPEGGRWPESGWRPGSLLLGTDPVAVDAAGARLIDLRRAVRGLPPITHDYLAAAEAAGLGSREARYRRLED